jgi:DNA polymerase zeta
LFIYLSGKTKEQAFRIGYDIADAVTRENPVPVKLKFEKVRRIFIYRTPPAKKSCYPFRFTCPVS